MSLSIFSKYEMDKFHFAKQNGEEAESEAIFARLYSSEKSLSTTYSDWDNVHSILFECCDGNTNTFYKDSVGFIPPHILSQIINSQKFKTKYRDIQSDLNEQLEIGNIYHYDNEEEDENRPNELLIKECVRDLEILNFIISLKKEGIYYS